MRNGQPIEYETATVIEFGRGWFYTRMPLDEVRELLSQKPGTWITVPVWSGGEGTVRNDTVTCAYNKQMEV